MSAMGMLIFAAATQGWKKSFWQDYQRAQDIITHTGEYGPHYAQLLGLVEMTLRVVTKRRGLLAAVTADIEWDGQPLGNCSGESACN
jgi:hypothetical protein